ncbi:hypothetical protein DFH29DRAFT_1007205 [Suillus ampliporus]|nr:hypothetical protein DFH29DRAFT_1007205 [Suillus ampliporus]
MSSPVMGMPTPGDKSDWSMDVVTEISMDVNDEDIVAVSAFQTTLLNALQFSLLQEIPKPEDGSDGCMDVDDADIEMLMLEEKSEWGMDVDDEDVVVVCASHFILLFSLAIYYCFYPTQENMPVEQAMQGIVDLEVFDEDIQMHA